MDKVWYVCYGSNLSEERFSYYIKGGSYCGRTYYGCRDKTPPENSKGMTIPYELYFAKKSGFWDNGGVAFISLAEDLANPTLGRGYLITWEQFLDVLAQENSKNPGDDQVAVLYLKTLKNKKMTKIAGLGWYDLVVYLGEEEGYPKFTFTHSEKYDLRPPAQKYLKVIGDGLKEVYNLSSIEIASYLLNKPGVFKHYKMAELIKLFE